MRRRAWHPRTMGCKIDIEEEDTELTGMTYSNLFKEAMHDRDQGRSSMKWWDFNAFPC